MAIDDVEMKPSNVGSEKVDKPHDSNESSKTRERTAVDEIKANVILIERAVSTLEPRFTHRVLRSLTSLRKRLTNSTLRGSIILLYSKGMFIIVFQIILLG